MEFLKLIPASQVLRQASVLLLAGMLNACQSNRKSSYINEEASVSIPGLSFSVQGARFLNQFVNPSARTISWLLADSGFVQNGSLAGFFSTGGKHTLCLLHWSQTDDPVWIGARIPGRFIRADLITYENGMLVVKQYQPNGMTVMASERYKEEIEKLLKEAGTVTYP
jgi:hypothetical protein